MKDTRNNTDAAPPPAWPILAVIGLVGVFAWGGTKIIPTPEAAALASAAAMESRQNDSERGREDLVNEPIDGSRSWIHFDGWDIPNNDGIDPFLYLDGKPICSGAYLRACNAPLAIRQKSENEKEYWCSNLQCMARGQIWVIIRQRCFNCGAMEPKQKNCRPCFGRGVWFHRKDGGRITHFSSR